MAQVAENEVGLSPLHTSTPYRRFGCARVAQLNDEVIELSSYKHHFLFHVISLAVSILDGKRVGLLLLGGEHGNMCNCDSR